jgi:pyruvate/2-oxoglutarate dehydrogenase complex dihydrolipoamide dehydrogenase (E3) component
MIIGGGPAGLEAARISAMRGHKVTVYEKQEHLGGRWYLGSQVPSKEHFIEIIEFYRDQAIKHGAKIEIGRTITREDVDTINPDVVIVATGSLPVIPPIPGADQDFVVTSDDVLGGKVELGERVVIVGGGSCGAETADYLAVQGKNVTVVEMLDDLCPDMLPDSKLFLLERLEEAGVVLLCSATVMEIEERKVVLAKRQPGQELQWTATLENVDNVILAAGAKADRRLAEELQGVDAELYEVGDCTQPGFAIDAIYQGAKIGREI